MPEPTQPNPDVTLSAALRELVPAAGLNRDRMLFEAGRAAARPACPWAWPATAGGFAMLAVAFAGVLAFSEPRIHVVERERPVYVQVPRPIEEPRAKVVPPSPEPAPRVAATPPPEDVRAADARRMVELRRDVLRWGVEVLPEPRTSSAPAQPPRDRDLQEMLRPTPGAFASPTWHPFRPPSIRSGGDE
jgi:hypothetical protein